MFSLRCGDNDKDRANANPNIAIADHCYGMGQDEQCNVPSEALAVQDAGLPPSKPSNGMLYPTRAISKYTSRHTLASYEAKIPVIVSADIHHIDLSLISHNAIRVTHMLQKSGFQAFIVGGAVRDLLLNIVPKDFDVATDATPNEIVKIFRRARLIGRRFQIVHVQFGAEIIEVSTFRAPIEITPVGAKESSDSKPNALSHKMRCSINRRMHAVDSSGRVLRDNVWGKQHQDATRRDFTINAMYYDPVMQIVLDYHCGMDDIRGRVLRMIGEPATRFREDPVRMLRTVRFAAKLDFIIEPSTQAPLAELVYLINNIPAARLFDEILKLLLSGYAHNCLKQLRALGLHHRVFPLLEVTLEQPDGEQFIMLALTNTDERVRSGKQVSPGFLFASLLWHAMQLRWKQYEASGEPSIPALYQALDEVLDQQTAMLAIRRRYTTDMREILELQPRLEKRSGRSALKLIEHHSFRAGYDFLLLRCEAGELDESICQWWKDFIAGDPNFREVMLKQREKERQNRRRRGSGSRNRKNSSANIL
ncbi:Poly(A) polymerase I [Candidatus Vallotia tarda]|uniref:Poly(A) polymerase I n=1 Tax=Candidatus Vallotiella hemipterorum TaxID=1177213 RepID=A0A916JT13_9BURK|nr:Poly(A) polymerase I [Candidatus Vallotia tarda]